MSTADGSVVGTAQILDNGPAASRWNLVIMSDGYQTAQLGQFATDAQTFVTTLLGTPPFDRLQRAINVFRVDVASTDAGADDPTACGGTGVTARTYFDASFCTAGIRRLLVVDTATALGVAAARVPQFHMAMVMVNSTVYGGSGGQVAVVSRAAGTDEIALHEMGHTAFRLADEYEFWAGCGVDTDRDRHPATEPAEANVTIDAARATNKWRALVTSATPMPTTSNADCSQCDTQSSPVGTAVIGAFEGAHYYHCGAYRPAFSCRMRALFNPFCGVCQRAIERTLTPFLPPNWTDPVQVPGWFGWENQGGGVAIADLNANGRPDLIVFHIDNPGRDNHGYYRIGHDLDANGNATDGWTEPIQVPGWFGWENQAGGVAIADLNANGRPDLIVFHIDNPGGENHGYYRIGWNLSTSGHVKGGWTKPIPIPGWFGSENQGGGIAVVDIDGNGRPDLVVFHIDNPRGENHGYYRIGWNLSTSGQVTGGWSNPTLVPGWFGSEGQGGGIAIGSVNGGRPDIVVFNIDNPGGDNHGYYRIGWELSPAGVV